MVTQQEVSEAIKERFDALEVKIDRAIRDAISTQKGTDYYIVRYNGFGWDDLLLIWPRYYDAGWKSAKGNSSVDFILYHGVDVKLLARKPGNKTHEESKEVLEERAIKLI